MNKQNIILLLFVIYSFSFAQPASNVNDSTLYIGRLDTCVIKCSEVAAKLGVNPNVNLKPMKGQITSSVLFSISAVGTYLAVLCYNKYRKDINYAQEQAAGKNQVPDELAGVGPGLGFVFCSLISAGSFGAAFVIQIKTFDKWKLYKEYHNKFVISHCCE